MCESGFCLFRGPLSCLAGLLLFLSGCQGHEVHGFSLSLGSFERGLWHDSDKRNLDKSPSWGIKADLTLGQWLRPIGTADGNSPWRGGEAAFVLRSPVPLPGIYLGGHLGDLGFYVGTKSYEATDRHRHGRYEKWMREEEFGTDAKPAVYLCPSASIRTTRWK
ncbi:MAG: hypothetical protein ACYTEL_21580 [Planctomycetota bacterium]